MIFAFLHRENTYVLMVLIALQLRLNKTGVHMKITLSREEVEKILLDYANKLIGDYGFNEVVAGSYRDLPPTLDLVRSEPKEVQS